MSEKHSFELFIDAQDGREGGMSLRQLEVDKTRAYILNVRDVNGREVELKLFMNATRRFPRSKMLVE